MTGLLRPHPQARRLVPEVVQTSTMDCGPASLQAFLAGFGLRVSYGRLREACQTSVDGTSISTMDEISNLLGLEAEEMMLPVEHLLLRGAPMLPAIVVVQNPNGTNHFVVAWSALGPWVQVMDPAVGRYWTLRSALAQHVYVHQMRLPASVWRSWAADPEFLTCLKRRIAALRVPEAAADRWIAAATGDAGWRPIGALEAAVRMVTSLVECSAVPHGAPCVALIDQLTVEQGEQTYPLLAPEYWSVRRSTVQSGDEELLVAKGAVCVRAHRRHARRVGTGAAGQEGSDSEPLSDPALGSVGGLPPELAAALVDDAPPQRTLASLLRADGLAAPLVLCLAVVTASALVAAQAAMLRGLLELQALLALPPQRFVAIAAVLGVVAASLLIELPIAAGALRLGRMLDLRLRMAFFAKLPRLDDRYFRSRLVSDMAERGHSLHMVRELPQLGLRLLSASAQLLFTTIGIVWLNPMSAPFALASLLTCVALPLAFHPLLAERDLRVRTHTAALGRFYFDALLGLLPIRVHGAKSAMQRQQQVLLIQWTHAGLRFYLATTLVAGAVVACGIVMTAGILWSLPSDRSGGLLLLVYWALSLPTLGQEIAMIVRQYPIQRNVMLRLLEPLGTPEALEREPQETGAVSESCGEPSARAVAIDMAGVSVKAGGNRVLEDVTLRIDPGEHIAIIGRSGAGKSSLVGLLLGWYRPAQGAVTINGKPLVGDWLVEVRRRTAWVDPSVTLWNRSFMENLRYGAGAERGDAHAEAPLSEVLRSAKLRDVLERLPNGLATEIGEGGRLVSGGEGQRVRVGRALARRHAHLVILDEPFRGLDATMRRELLATTRGWWGDATLLWVTHDIAEAESFHRVLVIDGGRIVEDGAPRELAQCPDSQYSKLVAQHRAMRTSEWSSQRWRHVKLDRGKLRDVPT
jgi:ABC-type bacteriocin/lantibiotic exporter with double-glycine peptidase domain